MRPSSPSPRATSITVLTALAARHAPHLTRGSARRGAALLEATIASGLLLVLLGGLWPVILAVRAASTVVRQHGLALHLARQRLSEIAALTHLRTSGIIVRDESTRLDDGEVFAVGGGGLRETGFEPLDAPQPGASEWLDEHGRWESGGPGPGPTARFLRQWALTTGDEDCVRVWVRVTTPHARGGGVVGGVQCPWGAPQP